MNNNNPKPKTDDKQPNETAKKRALDDISIEISDDETPNDLAICRARSCHRKLCDESSVIQARSSNELLTREARFEAIMRDMIRNNPTGLASTSHKKRASDLYSDPNRQSRLTLIVLGRKVCAHCYSVFYCTNISAIRDIRSRLGRGEEKFIDHRKLNTGANQYHTAEGVQSVREGVREYLRLLEEKYAIPPPPSAVASGVPIPLKSILPAAITIPMIMDDYGQFCADRGLARGSWKIVNESWKEFHPKLIREQRVRKHPFRDRRGRVKQVHKKKSEKPTAKAVKPAPPMPPPLQQVPTHSLYPSN